MYLNKHMTYIKSVNLLFIILALLINAPFSYSKDKNDKQKTLKNDLQKDHLMGNVKTITEKNYNVFGGKNDIISYNVTNYNKNGYTTTNTLYGPKDNGVKQTSYLYQGNLLVESIDSTIETPFKYITL